MRPGKTSSVWERLQVLFKECLELISNLPRVMLRSVVINYKPCFQVSPYFVCLNCSPFFCVLLLLVKVGEWLKIVGV